MHFSIPARGLHGFSLNIAWPAFRLELPKTRQDAAVPCLTRPEVEAIFRADLSATPLSRRKAAGASGRGH